jgi:hypothetical protein
VDSAPTPAFAPAREATRGELVDDSALAQLAAEIARQQAAPLTRTTYAGVYRAFCAFPGPDAGVDAVTVDSVRAYRDRLEQEGRSPATIASISPRCVRWPARSVSTASGKCVAQRSRAANRAR